jgi:hypothetical protein
MAEVPADWREVFGQAFRASPKRYANALRFGDYENSPVYDMLASSPGLSYLRQHLPQNLGAALPNVRLPNAVSNIPLGGYSAEEVEHYAEARRADPDLRRYTVQRGYVPTPGLDSEVKIGNNFKAGTAQAAGVVAADIATDGARNIWWFLNAPQALSMLASQQTTNLASREFTGRVPMIKNRNMRMAAAVPSWLGMSLGIGNFSREPGYKAVVPSEEDPRETANPLAEAGSRYFLGRAGKLLPYDEFAKERPDVSRAEYNAYKGYLFGNQWPLKATMDGIHGPEINFMGKTIPATTALLPAAAGLIGARHGIKRAGKYLRDTGGFDRQKLARNKYEGIRREVASEVGRDEAMKNPQVREAYKELAKQEEANELETLKRVLGWSGGAIAGGTGVGQVLESIRRSGGSNDYLEEV